MPAAFLDAMAEPFLYLYMVKAMGACALTGGACAFLSCYLVMKGWSLMGDALAHAIVPGVALASMLALPYSVGAFFAGVLAALGMAFVRQKTKLREDTVTGLVFTAFLASGLLMISLRPSAVNLQSIVLGNVLAIPDADLFQVAVISGMSLALLGLKWKDLTAVFFDESHARSVGLPVDALKIVFFALLSAAAVAALQTVGACLVIAMLVTPGATAFLLTGRFGRMIVIAVAVGILTGAAGAYASYFLDASTGGLVVAMQTAIFLLAFLFAPRGQGFVSARLAMRRGKGRKAVEG